MNKIKRGFRMKYIFLVCSVLLISSLSLPFNGYAKSDSVEKQYKSIGYTSDNAALKKFEEFYHQSTNISDSIKQQIPFKVTHEFGHFKQNDKDHLSLEYLNNNSKALFKVMVYPLKQEIGLSKHEKTGVLNDRTKFSYSKGENFYIFRFKTDEFAYVLSSNYLGENSNINQEKFISIAKGIKNKEFSYKVSYIK